MLPKNTVRTRRQRPQHIASSSNCTSSYYRPMRSQNLQTILKHILSFKMQRHLLLGTLLLAALTNPSAAFHPLHQTALIHRNINHAPSSTTQIGLIEAAANSGVIESDISLLSSSVRLAEGLLSTENIKVAFSVATFLPQVFWLFLIIIVSSLICGVYIFL